MGYCEYTLVVFTYFYACYCVEPTAPAPVVPTSTCNVHAGGKSKAVIVPCTLNAVCTCVEELRGQLTCAPTTCISKFSLRNGGPCFNNNDCQSNNCARLKVNATTTILACQPKLRVNDYRKTDQEHYKYQKGDLQCEPGLIPVTYLQDIDDPTSRIYKCKQAWAESGKSEEIKDARQCKPWLTYKPGKEGECAENPNNALVPAGGEEYWKNLCGTESAFTMENCWGAWVLWKIAEVEYEYLQDDRKYWKAVYLWRKCLGENNPSYAPTQLQWGWSSKGTILCMLTVGLAIALGVLTYLSYGKTETAAAYTRFRDLTHT